MDKKLRKGLRTWIEIDKKAIKHNYSVFRSLIPKNTKFLAVVKSNAYGHSLIDFSKEIVKNGVDFLGVDSIVEGLALRREEIKTPILVLGYTLPELFNDAVEKNISITVSSFDTISKIKKLKIPSSKKLKIHIKADTGMCRHGFLLKDLDKVIREIKNFKNVEVEGLFTHFSIAKDPAFPNHTRKQIKEFNIWVDAFKKAGFNPICHASATSGAIVFPEAAFDMVRIGIGLYGVWPSKETEKAYEDKINLKPVLSWKTIIGEIKKVPKGSRVGYDGTEILEKDSMIAICPIGYWHGFLRDLSCKAKILVKGKKVKVLGRVCMDIIIIDISDVKGVKVGDEVVIIGKSRKEQISVDDISSIIAGSSYEFLTRINPLIKKFYL
ncbi:MAG: alanine racemase [Candidatus Pacebacteria bacterium]|nr:alanine racemase [Candidatus Paceibacterota bacterium]